MVCLVTRLLSPFFLPWLPPLPAPVSPWVSGGGKARVFAKLMICLCAKLTGGWTSTRTWLTASRPLSWHPRSPARAPCQLQPLPTPMPVALAPQSMPKSTPHSWGPSDLRDKTWCCPLGPPEPCSVQPWLPRREPLWPPWEPHQHRDSHPGVLGGKQFP